MPIDERDTDPIGPEPPPPEPGIFSGINNYLLLVYAGACILMNYSIAGIFYFKGMIYLSLILPGIFSILIPLYLLSRRSALGFVREFMLEPPVPATILLVMLVSASSILPIETLSSVFERMWAPDADYTSFILSIKPKGPGSFALVSLGLAVIAPFAEELVFRGFIQRIFMRNMSGPLAVFLAGAIFALAHFNLPVLPGVLALGVLYGFIAYLTRCLWYPIAAHAVFNFASLLRLNDATEEEIVSARLALPGLSWMLVSLVVFALSLWLLVRMQRLRRTRA